MINHLLTVFRETNQRKVNPHIRKSLIENYFYVINEQ
jgi:hypothetical protein